MPKSLGTSYAVALSSAPSAGSAGNMYYNTSTSLLNVSNGSTWAAIAADSAVVHLAGTETVTGGKTFSTTLITATPTTSIASIRLPHGVAPASPTNGDMWTTTSGLYVRINGSTVGPLGSGGGSTFDSILTTSGATTAATLWSDITTGSITIGNGLTTGNVNIGNGSSSGNTIIRSPQLYIGATNNQQIIFTGGATNHGIELGRVDGTSSTPFIDFHAGTTAVDYDVRIMNTGTASSGTIGAGNLEVTAKSIQLTAVGGQYPTFTLLSPNSTGFYPAFFNFTRYGVGGIATPSNNSIGTFRFDGRDASNGYASFAEIEAGIGTNAAGGAPATMTFRVSNTGTGAADTMRLNADKTVTFWGSLLGPIIYSSGSAPSSPSTGAAWFNTSDGGLYIYNSSTWVGVGGGAIINDTTSATTSVYSSSKVTSDFAPKASPTFTGTVTAATTTLSGLLTVATGTTSLAPISFGSGGSIKTSPAQGDFEWNGNNLYITANTSTGGGREVNLDAQHVLLPSGASAIATGTDFFPSLRPMMVSGDRHYFKYYLMFTKNTAGTVTFQLKNSGANNFTYIHGTAQLYLQATGALAAVGDIRNFYAAGAATVTLNATKSLTAAANYVLIVDGWCVPSANTRLSIAPSAYGAGTITTLAGSNMYIIDMGSANTGNLG